VCRVERYERVSAMHGTCISTLATLRVFTCTQTSVQHVSDPSVCVCVYTPIIAGTRSVMSNVGNVLIAGVLNRTSPVPRLLCVERYNYWNLTGGADRMTARCCNPQVTSVPVCAGLFSLFYSSL